MKSTAEIAELAERIKKLEDKVEEISKSAEYRSRFIDVGNFKVGSAQ